VLIVRTVTVAAIGMSVSPLVTMTRLATNLVQLLAAFWRSIKKRVKINTVSHLVKHVPQLVHPVVHRTTAKEHGPTQRVSNELLRKMSKKGSDREKQIKTISHRSGRSHLKQLSVKLSREL
jgi:hypothetical protein